MLFAIDLNGAAHRARGNGEDFINGKGVAVTSMLSFQSPGVDRSELDAPKAHCFAADSDASLGQEIFFRVLPATCRQKKPR